MRQITRTLVFAALLAAATAPLQAQLKEYGPSRLNLFSPQQDVEMGRQAAEEVNMTMPLVDNQELIDYVNGIGQRLAASPKAGGYPYEFRIINDNSINAFALPGGPVYVHTGLLAALDNESQLAGVLAHEISHVALRHGTHQMSKAQGLQLGLMLGVSMIGGGKGIWNTVAQVAGGLGAQSLLLKYSRDAEREADLHGAQIMHEIGYDPVQMAVFFEKLQAGGQQDDGFLANFLADHPSPGNRIEYVQEQNQYLPRKDFLSGDARELARVKNVVASLPPPPEQKETAVASGQGNAADPRPSGRYTQHDGRDYALVYPDNWQTFGDEQSGVLTVAPQAGVVADANGQTQIAYGFIAAYYYPQDERVNLQRDTRALLSQIEQSNTALQQNGQQRQLRVAGRDAILTPFEMPSPLGNQREFDVILTVERPEGLFYMVFISPENEWQAIQQTFDDVVKSIKFASDSTEPAPVAPTATPGRTRRR